ncbi:MAG: HAD-IC family P-type ATPase [Clostridia bacterium]|nr:HAD-IC family P-type ATPase [Clostridia bacterium]
MERELKLPDSLPADFAYTPESGLTGPEAERRKGAGMANTPPQDGGKTTAQIVLGNVFTFFNALNLLLAAALILVGSWRNLMFLGVVVTNTGIAILQEWKARNTIRRLKLLNAPKVHAIRDGRETEITSGEAVAGDILVLRGGDQAVADGIVLRGGGRAMEGLLTGESDAIAKKEGDWIYSGSYLTEGKVFYQLVYVGEESYVSRLSHEAKQIRKPYSGLMGEMEKLIRLDACVLLPLGALLFLKQFFLQHVPLGQAVPTSVAAMLGMIPEGLMLLASIAMAVGVVRLGRKQVLVQELYGIEGLARVDTICLDKTGTITTGRLQADEIVPLAGTEEETKAALSRFLGAFDDSSATLKALGGAVAPGAEKPVAIQPFSSERKKSAASFRDGKTLILGAPEFVLAREVPGDIREKISARTREGKRVLLLAEGDGTIQGDVLPAVSRPLALCCLRDEIRPHARETIQYFKDQGVAVRVISGDHPETVSRVARAAGIDGAEKAVDARGLDTPEKIREACRTCTVFGRVTPGQKKQIVEAMKAEGHTVAMTGDGVNDIPALRAADCSIAMAEGADAARHAAQITLLKSDFGVVPEIVQEGRRIINNITRSATLFLTKTIFSFLLSLLTLALPGMYPFQPIQMTLVSACTVGIPGFFLALEPSRERIRGRFLETVIRRALPGGVAVAVCATLAMLLTRAGWSPEACSTLATGAAGAMCLIALGRACVPFDLTRALVLAGSAGLFSALALTLGSVFFLTPLTGAQYGALAGLSALGAGIYALTDILEKRQRAKRA